MLYIKDSSVYEPEYVASYRASYHHNVAGESRRLCQPGVRDAVHHGDRCVIQGVRNLENVWDKSNRFQDFQ